MSTKSSLAYGENFHLYEEVFEPENIYLELQSISFEVSNNKITVAIPAAVWECIRRFPFAELSLVNLTDDMIREQAEKKVNEQISVQNKQENKLVGLSSCTLDCTEPPIQEHISDEVDLLLSERDYQRSLQVDIDEFESLVKPVQHPLLSDFCSQLTRIQQEAVGAADTFGVVFPQFQNWLNKYDDFLFASWGSYDSVQLQLDCEFHGIKPLRIAPILNIKKAFAKSQKLRSQVGMRKALQLAGLSTDGAHHRGLDDARNIAKLIPFALGYKTIVQHR